MDEHATAPGALKDTRLLLVEDEVLIAMDVSDFLEDAGARVDHAVSLGRALALARANRYDGAVLDVTLGRHDNCVPVAEVLHADGVPFILHSGDPERQGEVVAAFTAPLVRKPSAPEEVIAALSAELRKARATAEA